MVVTYAQNLRKIMTRFWEKCLTDEQIEESNSNDLIAKLGCNSLNLSEPACSCKFWALKLVPSVVPFH